MTTSFDDRAAGWDDEPSHAERARAIARTIRRVVEPRGDTRLLEYGAGTGLLSQELAADVGPITVTDPSPEMREVVAAKMAAGKLPDARVTDLDLARDPVPDERYDLVVVMMALHHVPELAPVLEGFATLLAPDGTLCIADLDSEDGSFHAGPVAHTDEPAHDHPAGHGHGDPAEDEVKETPVHHGFDRGELAGWLTDAGFGPTRFDDVYEMERGGRDYGVFLATTALANRL